MKMVCAICHSHCESDIEQTFRIVIRDDYEALANIPCTARNRFNQMSGLNFKADGRRYVVDVYRGHKTTLIGGDDWAKFKHDFDVGQGNVVVFDMTGRTAKAYVAGVEAEEQGGAAEEVVAVDEEEEVVNDDHGLEDALAFVNTRGFVFEDGEYAMMELILTIQHLYIGPPFVHRLTPTIIAGKLMKIPKKVAQPLNLDTEGVLGLCMGVGDVMQVAYHTDRDGRIVFNQAWGVFVAQNHLQVNDAVVFNFREINEEHINLVCVVNALRPAEP
uniref:TF-B3 domain-containing protein n=1 Tax=Aegilops tauschii TaxID=37682 RepID=M8BVM5_AEGTA